MKHTHTNRVAILGVTFASLAIVFAAQITGLRSTAHGLRVQADAVEVRPPAMPGSSNVLEAAKKRERARIAQRKKVLQKRVPKTSPRRGVTF
jgi:hypothetical protein